MDRHKGEHKFEKIYQEVVEKSANYSVLASDAGALLVSTKSGGAMTFTLPPVATSKGCEFYFMQTVDQNMAITAPANLMRAKNDATATTVTYQTASNKIGAACRVVCDGSYYYFFEMSNCTPTVT